MSRHPQSEPSVRLNDFVFALHGTVLVLVVLSQFWPLPWGFRIEKYQSPSRLMLAACTACVGYALATILIVTSNTNHNRHTLVGHLEWLDVVYAFGNVKLFATTCKYIPQVWVNFKRKATYGFSIEAILLDLTGGVLSIMQLLLDGWDRTDWSAVTGNPAKFVLGNISIFFDAIFILQHYYLYRQKNMLEERQASNEQEPLLHNEGSCS
ncbi:MAG: hypothetical protein M1831_005128 [Alyxoria varia]|nr:MAG: hypothetical protein M1831_005128 [Alyxoria varia]